MMGCRLQIIEREVAEHITAHSSGTIDYVSLLSYPALTPFEAGTSEAILACAVQFRKNKID